MIETIVSTIKSFEWTGMMGILLYWIPLAVCAVGYFIRTFHDIAKDAGKRDQWVKWSSENPNLDPSAEWEIRKDWPRRYEPSVTIGDLIGRGIASVIPVCNLLCAVFSIAPEFLSGFFSTLSKIFNQPLVPPKK